MTAAYLHLWLQAMVFAFSQLSLNIIMAQAFPSVINTPFRERTNQKFADEFHFPVKYKRNFAFS
jgi:hypothetical protein